jgi:DNA-binding NtrC family response regulator
MDRSIKLLIVDDEVKFLESIARRLKMRGFDVTTAENGEKAVEAARSAGFDLALLDLKMPGMDGKQVLAKLKKEHKYLEVIILTGHGSVDSAVECTKLGAFGYLPKPYELEELMQVLRQAYEARMKKKFETNQAKLEQITRMAIGSSPLEILRELAKLDDDEK